MGLISDPAAKGLRIFKHGDASYAADVPTCVACVQPHPQAEIVLQDGSVYYRCARYASLIFVRDQKEKGKK